MVDFAVLKRDVPIAQVVSMLELQLKPINPDQLRGACPIHHGDNPRGFAVTLSKSLWFCFGGCGGGDQIALVAKLKQLSTKEAAEWIAGGGKTSHTVPGPDADNGSGTAPQNEKGALKPLDYLQPEHELVQALGVTAETCRQFGAGYAPKGILRGRLAIPIHDPVGALLAYCGRAVTSEQQPLLAFPNGFTPESVIFNAHRIGEGELYLVRDPLSVLTAFEAGIENVVAFLTERIIAQQLEQLASLMDEKRCDMVELF